jgi:hypothetical protein
MRSRSLAWFGGLLSAALVFQLPGTSTAGQTPAGTPRTGSTGASKAASVRTPWGDPDLQGIWANMTSTPLEAPTALIGKSELTPEERAKMDAAALRAHLSRDSRRQQPGSVTDVGRAYNAHWFPVPGKALSRPALVTDPADGRIPEVTPQARERFAAYAAALGRTGSAAVPEGRGEGVEDGTEGGTDGRGQRADHPEDRRLSERCIIWAPLPRLPGGYNNHVRIVQQPGYVMIEHEMIHDARVVPLDGRPHLPKNVRLWLGDSRGHWEGNTLVVDTTNFDDKAPFRGSFANMHLVERFTRVDADTVSYEVRIEDPSTFVRPWTVAFPLTRPDDPLPQMFEYACHEGNYGLTGQLAGTRAEQAAAAQKKGSR